MRRRENEQRWRDRRGSVVSRVTGAGADGRRIAGRVVPGRVVPGRRIARGMVARPSGRRIAGSADQRARGERREHRGKHGAVKESWDAHGDGKGRHRARAGEPSDHPQLGRRGPRPGDLAARCARTS
jgi:hypothetical protein